ncbi:formate dehydrogenase accessory sulfurtransferase FdhD [Paenibacillus sp. TRM 82003]|uniref:formate dehydrogenase accessory sulfurtransferase FdhD n=1 Tax=Kineococcus sp. TRM81007 TaxID=2925831 RepID=UPI001F5993BC|nr:formate dehydrogenase accessory sulfurtransferase FdhD [Kineococcus sp. TRM81007]MCI2240159.1 formate dehydrogenase accessory sulfurtransferase FdhD [Kineococcus sp. TRM81007]MCI3925532.1 formate dehydrogenase accessory sulfurtransferase FdhD [Paenibacillus sp. TRM 82003]
MGRVTTRTRTERLDLRPGAAPGTRVDTLAVEEPLQIEVAGEQLAVTMRTPGHDVDLVMGFLHAEGLLAGAGDVVALRHCTDLGEDGQPTYNVAQVTPRPGSRLAGRRTARPFTTTSACGVCGSASVQEVLARVPAPLHDDGVLLDPAVLAELPGALRAHQSAFDRTGGLHAAGLFTADGELLCLREDVGRHNAVDKVVGWALRSGAVPLRGRVLVVSGRASFELVQKAAVAGVPVLAAVSAPSSLAVSLAREAGMTLVGFLRPPTANVYAGGHRLRAPAHAGVRRLPGAPTVGVAE